ncbi:retrovirus-related pol polyprotein from transposon TNT 1-94 [Tanacetum coccineum]
MSEAEPIPPTSSVTALRIPMIKKGEYDLWSMKMRQYIAITDHILWDIITNGDQATTDPASSSAPKTSLAANARRNNEKALNILLSAIPDRHLLSFHDAVDARTLWLAIKARFGGNEASKKMQKNLLKQQFETFTIGSREELDSAYERFQHILSMLELYDAKVSQEDANLKFLRSLPSVWHVYHCYVDDIIFGSTKKSLCIEFEKMMHKKFQMSSMGELTFFLGLQVKQKEDGIFISQNNSGILSKQKIVNGEVQLQAIVDKKKVIITESTIRRDLQLEDANGVDYEQKIESKKPLKKKDRIMYDQEVALNLQAQLQAGLEEEERLIRQKEKEANIALIESWDNTQAMMDVDYQMAQQLQAEEQEQLSIEEKLKLFVQLLEARKKHFAEIRAREKRNKPPTQAQQRKLYCNYLKNMEGYTLKQLKGFKFKVIKDMFDKAFKRVKHFLAKKQKIDDDQEEARMKELMNIVPDEEEVAIDAIPLATKPLCIVDWKIIKEGKISQFQIIRADGSSKRYSAFIHMLRNFDREDLKTLWKLVKAKHGSTKQGGHEKCYEGI